MAYIYKSLSGFCGKVSPDVSLGLIGGGEVPRVPGEDVGAEGGGRVGGEVDAVVASVQQSAGMEAWDGKGK